MEKLHSEHNTRHARNAINDTIWSHLKYYLSPGFGILIRVLRNGLRKSV